jgi:hypothetical protein
MIRELDLVALTHDVPEHGLKTGDVGTVVHVHTIPGYMVEFMDSEGYTVAVISLEPSEVRPVSPHEMQHARPLEKRA